MVLQYNASFSGTLPPDEHAGVRCDGCSGPIRGVRNKCSICTDYDLCTQCKQKGIHNHHMMHEIHPQPSPPTQHPNTPTQYPAYPQTPAQYPAYPQTPTQYPAYPQTPTQYPAYPQTPTQNPGYPQTPTQYPAYPQTPTQYPPYPQTPTKNPANPQTPTQNPGCRQTPTQYPAYPQTPTQYPPYPQTPTQNPGCPQTPTQYPAYPQTPTQNPGCPQTPTQYPAYPQTPTQYPAYPQTPSQYPAYPQTPTQYPGYPHTTQSSSQPIQSSQPPQTGSQTVQTVSQPIQGSQPPPGNHPPGPAQPFQPGHNPPGSPFPSMNVNQVQSLLQQMVLTGGTHSLPAQTNTTSSGSLSSSQDLTTAKWNPPVAGISSKRHQLQSSDPEYQAVIQNMAQNGGAAWTSKVLEISRIENYPLYNIYKSCKAEMDREYGQGFQSERILWHGTDASVLGNIYRGGFNRSYCGKNATAFGDGVYFATSFSYSASATYSPPDSKAQKYIFQSRVLTGHFIKGKSGLKEPPMRTQELRYDSVVDNTGKPSMFVIFKDMQVYPEYVITLKA